MMILDLLVSLEHVQPERLYLVDVSTLAIHRNSSQKKAFGEITFKTDFVGIRTSSFVLVVFAQPHRIRQALHC